MLCINGIRLRIRLLLGFIQYDRFIFINVVATVAAFMVFIITLTSEIPRLESIL